MEPSGPLGSIIGPMFRIGLSGSRGLTVNLLGSGSIKGPLLRTTSGLSGITGGWGNMRGGASGLTDIGDNEAFMEDWGLGFERSFAAAGRGWVRNPTPVMAGLADWAD